VKTSNSHARSELWKAAKNCCQKADFNREVANVSHVSSEEIFKARLAFSAKPLQCLRNGLTALGEQADH